MLKTFQIKKVVFRSFFVISILIFGTILTSNGLLISANTAKAAEGGHSGGHSGGGHSSGGHSDGHDSGHEDDSHAGHTPGSKGKGRGHSGRQGGSGHDVARGGGKAVENSIFRERRPVWAREGIPEVELGRLNVSRAPGHVLARAEAEALLNYSEEMAALYNISADEAASLLQTNYRDIARFDSPLQNLALYKDLIIFGQSQLSGINPRSQIDLAAIFLGSASDKNIPVTEDTVIAVNRILGLIELAPDDRASLVSKADQVRSAILTGHGDTEH